MSHTTDHGRLHERAAAYGSDIRATMRMADRALRTGEEVHDWDLWLVVHELADAARWRAPYTARERARLGIRGFVWSRPDRDLLERRAGIIAASPDLAAWDAEQERAVMDATDWSDRGNTNRAPRGVDKRAWYRDNREG